MTGQGSEKGPDSTRIQLPVRKSSWGAHLELRASKSLHNREPRSYPHVSIQHMCSTFTMNLWYKCMVKMQVTVRVSLEDGLGWKHPDGQQYSPTSLT